MSNTTARTLIGCVASPAEVRVPPSACGNWLAAVACAPCPWPNATMLWLAPIVIESFPGPAGCSDLGLAAVEHRHALAQRRLLIQQTGKPLPVPLVGSQCFVDNLRVLPIFFQV